MRFRKFNVDITLIKTTRSSNLMECNSPMAVRLKAYRSLCTHSLYAFARMGNAPNYKEPAQGDLRSSCTSANSRAVSKRRSEDIDVAHMSSKKARFGESICMPSASDTGTDQITSESYEVFHAGTPAQAVVHDSMKMLSKYGPRVQDGINAFVVGMLSSYFSVLFLKICLQITSCISVMLIVRALSDRMV